MHHQYLIALIKCIVWVILWAIVFILIGFVIVNFTSYSLKYVLFIEGIVLVALGALSSIGGNPTGLSLQALVQDNAQYVANANLEVTKMEKQRHHDNIKTNLRSSFNIVSLIIGGAICIIINFII